MLTIKNLYAGYTRENPILKGIDLTISDGDVVGILGRNGSGKSTLAKAICGLMPHVSGEIYLDGNQILGKCPYEIARMGVGFFQQGGRVFSNLTVSENIEFACSGLNSDEKQSRIIEVTEWFEVLQKPERWRMKSSYLSGGEKHQLALAMVLIQEPKQLILDETSAGLSHINSITLLGVVKMLRYRKFKNILLIEQNLDFARGICTKLVALENGRIIN